MNLLEPDYPAPSKPFMPRMVTDITQRVIHHSAGPITQTPLEIDAFERQRADHFIYIPYCYVIGPTGSDYTKPVLYRGRPYMVVEGATFGEHLQSLSVCVLGNFERGDAGYTGPPTQELKDLLVQWGVYTQTICPAISRTIGHKDTALEQGYDDQCPGSDLIVFLPELRQRIAQAFNHRGG